VACHRTDHFVGSEAPMHPGTIPVPDWSDTVGASHVSDHINHIAIRGKIMF
jgi:hypothetical protein